MTRLFCDVDGTLIDKDDVQRPGIKDILKRLSKCFDKIYIWSGGGGRDYSERKLKGATEYVTAYYSKADVFNTFTIGEGDVCIDDRKNVVENFKKKGATGYWVPYYEPNLFNRRDRNENKEALEKVCQQIEEAAWSTEAHSHV